MKKVPEILTVIMRSDGPMVCAGDSPSYRTIKILLTEEQRASLVPRFDFHNNGKDHYESISKAILE